MKAPHIVTGMDEGKKASRVNDDEKRCREHNVDEVSSEYTVQL
jgi:hypothetical protein